MSLLEDRNLILDVRRVSPWRIKLLFGDAQITQGSKSFIVTFKAKELALKAALLDGVMFDGRRIKISFPAAIKTDYLFLPVAPSIRERIQMDEVAKYSVTEWRSAEFIARLLKKLVGERAVACDATACVGGMTVALSKHFKHVDAFEQNETRHKMLRANLQLFKRSNVRTYNADVVEFVVLGKLRYDAVMFDPPWENNPDMLLSGKRIKEICERLKCKVAIIGVPKQFNARLLGCTRFVRFFCMKVDYILWDFGVVDFANRVRQASEGVPYRYVRGAYQIAK